MVEKLQNICLDSICLNLSLNYELFKQSLNTIIPKKYMEKIYNNSFEIVDEFKENDLSIFNEKFFSIKNINLLRKQFKNVKNYNFLNKQNLNNCIIGNVEKFDFTIKNFSFKTKKLEINFNVENNVNKLKIFLEKCEILEFLKINSVNKSKLKYEKWLNFINFGTSIKCIDLIEIQLEYEEFKLLTEIIQNKTTLDDLSLNLNKIKGKDIDSNEVGKYLNLIPDSITKFRISFEQNKVSSCLSSFIGHHKNIKKFYIEEPIQRECLALEIIDALHVNLSRNIEVLAIKFSEISANIHCKILKLFENCSSLKELYIDNDPGISFFGLEICYSFLNSKCKLERFDIFLFDVTEIAEFFYDILPFFSNLTHNDIGYALYLEPGNQKFLQFIDCIKNRTKVLSISKWDISILFMDNISLNNFSNVTEIILYSIRFVDNFLEYFSYDFDTEKICKTIKKLEISFSSIDENGAKAIQKYFLSCNCLESIKFQEITIHRFMIDGLKPSTSTLQFLNFTDCLYSDVEIKELNSLFKKCQKMKNFIIKDNLLSCKYFYDFLESLRNSTRSLEYFGSIPEYNDDDKSAYDSIYDEISKSFHKLIKIL